MALFGCNRNIQYDESTEKTWISKEVRIEHKKNPVKFGYLK